jgi:hypothetical protein
MICLKGVSIKNVAIASWTQSDEGNVMRPLCMASNLSKSLNITTMTGKLFSTLCFLLLAPWTEMDALLFDFTFPWDRALAG